MSGEGGGGSVEQDALLDLLAADGADGDAVATHLAHAVPAQEYHVLEPVQADRAHRLQTRNTPITLRTLIDQRVKQQRDNATVLLVRRSTKQQSKRLAASRG